MQLLVQFYTTNQPPISTKSLEVLLLLSSVRRSLFTTDAERRRFLAQLLTAMRAILRERTGLSDSDNYHIFCRMLGRLKSNYQLSEMVKTEGYPEWIQLTADFTIQSFGNWQWSQNSVHYLLALWARLVAAIPYFKPSPSTVAGGKNDSMLSV